MAKRLTAAQKQHRKVVKSAKRWVKSRGGLKSKRRWM